jgi:hypothetical protein
MTVVIGKALGSPVERLWNDLDIHAMYIRAVRVFQGRKVMQ